jgi:hypothetical protein
MSDTSEEYVISLEADDDFRLSFSHTLLIDSWGTGCVETHAYTSLTSAVWLLSAKRSPEVQTCCLTGATSPRYTFGKLTPRR